MKDNLDKVKLLARDLRDGKEYPRSPRETGGVAEETLMAAMATYHEEWHKKGGALHDASGLQPNSKGWRVKSSGGKRTVVDGPFTETKELIGATRSRNP